MLGWWTLEIRLPGFFLFLFYFFFSPLPAALLTLKPHSIFLAVKKRGLLSDKTRSPIFYLYLNLKNSHFIYPIFSFINVLKLNSKKNIYIVYFTKQIFLIIIIN